MADPQVAIVVPCLNEEMTIGKVVDDFRRVMPGAVVYVIDNGSVDATAQVARAKGARVITETRRGKGFAMRTAFRRINADLYVMVDGDDTYPAEALPALMEPVTQGRADMVVGSRLMAGTTSDFRRRNRFGNWVYRVVIGLLLGGRLTDILSGYRVMTREFVRSVPITGSGFEIEAELTVRALEHDQRIVEVPIDLRSRPEGSHSKIRIFSDGYRILWTILTLFRDYRPMTFFGFLGSLALIVGAILGYSVLIEFLETGLVPRFPTAILAAALELAGILFVGIGLILSAVSRRFRQIEARLDMMDFPPAADASDGLDGEGPR